MINVEPPTERPSGKVSKVVGLYQNLLRRYLEHFFPDAILEAVGDRSHITWSDVLSEASFRMADEPGGLGVELEWFRNHYVFSPGSPSPFLPTERRLIAATGRVLDRRFRALFDAGAADREEMFHYAIEDQVVAEYLGTPDPIRIPAALEALRVAALSTYENRRVSTGVLLLGTDGDPGSPGRVNLPGAPRYGSRLSTIKSFHRICDGRRTVFVVDRNGDLAWPVDIKKWAERVYGGEPLEQPNAREYLSHACASRRSGHVVLVLSPSQEIKVFSEGACAFTFGDARWRLQDTPTKYAAWCKAIGSACPSDLAGRLFRAALNLGEDRHGALFVVLRDPGRSVAQLVAPGDRIVEDVVADDPEDPDNLSPRLAKRSLHHLVRGQGIADLDDSVLEALAGIDGAIVTDTHGRLLSIGAILRVAPETVLTARAVEGARTTAALAASFHGPTLKVSEDGFLTMFLGGRRVWEL